MKIHKWFIYALLSMAVLFLTACDLYEGEAAKIQIFNQNPYGANYYLIYQNGQGVLIDAGSNAQEITSFVKNNNLKVSYIFLTHGHYDHVTAALELTERLQAQLVLQQEDLLLFRKTVGEATPSLVKDESTFSVGDMKFTIIPTPGHTPGSLIIKTGNFVFTGDTLFKESVGRTDLDGGDEGALFNSINSKILIYPDNTVIYPGHGDQSTLGYEKKNNPFLQYNR